MRNDGGDPLDTLIADTARSLTEGAPPVSLRASVRERIEAPRKGAPHIADGGQSRVGRPFTGRLVWTAAAAVVVLAIVVGRALLGSPGGPDPPSPAGFGEVRPPANDPRPTNEVVAVAPPETRVPVSAAEVVTVERIERAPRRRPAAIAPAPVVVEMTAVTAEEDALVIEPVVIELLAPEPLELELMELPMPLRAEQIAIQPIVIE